MIPLNSARQRRHRPEWLPPAPLVSSRWRSLGLTGLCEIVRSRFPSHANGSPTPGSARWGWRASGHIALHDPTKGTGTAGVSRRTGRKLLSGNHCRIDSGSLHESPNCLSDSALSGCGTTGINGLCMLNAANHEAPVDRFGAVVATPRLRN